MSSVLGFKPPRLEFQILFFIWRAMSSDLTPYPQEVLLSQFTVAQPAFAPKWSQPSRYNTLGLC